MQRRQAIQNVALLLGGTLVGGNLFLAGGCKPATTTVENLFTPDMQTLLGEIAETILPATATPGAKEAGVGEFIPVMVRDCYDEKHQKVFVDGVVTIEKLSKEKYGKDFLKITPEQRTELLTRLDTEQKKYQETKEKDAPPHYFRLMKELTLLGFFSSEVGATKALRYVAVPGRFDACIEYKKGDKAWA
ncbi:MAG: gluconate 2-dehydrogenase subunit 3 family protein [Chitinophagaceae bacterium]|nr:gluconate 2-dehydrogenase subunit 3 family protein [Chitinophagaceae bacterium]